MKKYLDYLPELFSEISEFRQIGNAIDEQTAKLYDAQNKLLESQFISTASENALSRYEKMLNLQPVGSVESRRMRLSALFSDKPPYSLSAFICWLERICGADGYTLEYQPDSFQLTIRIALSKLSAFDDIAYRCRLIIPANITFSISPMYTTHITLSELTHELLSHGSHGQTKLLIKETA